MSDVASAYAECERITREQARNFAWGIRLLPERKRQHLSAVYAFARRIDDIGDGDLPVPQKQRLLAEARAQALAPDAHPDDPVLVALADAARAARLPLNAFADLVDGCERDVRGHDYADLDDLVTYCRFVAGSIGRLSLAVFGGGVVTAEDSALADDLGVALQLTNILRDIREDLTTGRVYLPAKDLELFGVELRLLPDGTLDPCDGALAELIRFEAARAWGWYDRGLGLVDRLDRRSAACCSAMAGIYHVLLQRIAADPSQVFDRRLSLPAATKLGVAGRALAGRALAGRAPAGGGRG